MKRFFLALMLAVSCAAAASAQNKVFTRQEVMQMSPEEISNMPLEDIMAAIEALGVSSVDELFGMIMNKNVSSASKKEENSFTAPLSTSVITRDEIRTYGISTIEEALRLIPGMIIAEKTNGNFDVQIRGLNAIPDNNWFTYTENPNVLLMLNGRILNNYVMGAISLDLLPISIEDVAQIEVVRGATSALYGANAVQGVINIITEKPNVESKLVSAHVQYGTQNSILGELGIRKSWGAVAAGATFNVQRRERDTDKLFVMPWADGMIYKYDPQLAQQTGQQLPAIGEAVRMPRLQQLQAMGILTDISETGAWLSIDEVQNMKQGITFGSNPTAEGPEFFLYEANEPESPLRSMFRHQKRSRDIKAFNAYLSINPTPDVAIDLSGGYQNSYVITTPMGDDMFSYNVRTSKTAYVNLEANLWGLKLQSDFMQGPQDFSDGVPVNKEKVRAFGVSAEYDVNLKGLNIRPGISYRNNYYEDYDYYYDYGNGPQKMSGYLNPDAEMTNFSASLRLDYAVGNARFIAAYRADKPNIPDKWTHSVSAVAAYEINRDNFVRLTYGRGNRSAVLMNTSASYNFVRTNMSMPSEVQIVGNEDADLMKIDNFELGYRFRPTSNLLVDLEAFFSISKDYGEFYAYKGLIGFNASDFEKLYNAAGPDLEANAPAYFQNATMTAYSFRKAFVQYQNLPFKAKQLGLSINADWIIMPKLVAKFNLNLQKTKIDDYFRYNQKQNIQQQFQDAAQNGGLGQVIGQTTGPIAGKAYGETYGPVYGATMAALTAQGLTPPEAAAQAEATATNAAMQAAIDAVNGTTFANGNMLTTESYLRVDSEQQDGYEHKSTPAFYGNVGLVYKPMQKLTLTGLANFLAERTYYIKYGSETLDPRFTFDLNVAYKPLERLEVFFNAHNLFNTEKREFIFSDELGGIYSIGINFNL